MPSCSPPSPHPLPSLPYLSPLNSPSTLPPPPSLSPRSTTRSLTSTASGWRRAPPTAPCASSRCRAGSTHSSRSSEGASPSARRRLCTFVVHSSIAVVCVSLRQMAIVFVLCHAPPVFHTDTHTHTHAHTPSHSLTCLASTLLSPPIATRPLLLLSSSFLTPLPPTALDLQTRGPRVAGGMGTPKVWQPHCLGLVRQQGTCALFSEPRSFLPCSRVSACRSA